MSGDILNLGKCIFKERFFALKSDFLRRKCTNVVADNGLWLRALPAENSPNVSNLLLQVLKEFSRYFHKKIFKGQCQDIFSLPGFSSNSSSWSQEACLETVFCHFFVYSFRYSILPGLRRCQ
jgi:hypothetical protein